MSPNLLRPSNVVIATDPTPRLTFGSVVPDSLPVTVPLGRTSLPAYLPTGHPPVWVDDGAYTAPVVGDPGLVFTADDDEWGRRVPQRAIWIYNGASEGIPEWRLAALTDAGYRQLQARDPSDPLRARRHPSDARTGIATPGQPAYPIVRFSGGKPSSDSDNWLSDTTGGGMNTSTVLSWTPGTTTLAALLNTFLGAVDLSSDYCWQERHRIVVASDHGYATVDGCLYLPSNNAGLDPDVTYRAETTDVFASELFTPGARVAIMYDRSWRWVGRVWRATTSTPLPVHV